MNREIDVNKIRGSLFEKKISQGCLAEMLKVSRATVNSMLANRSEISASALVIISRLTEYPMEYFLCNRS